MIVLGVRFNALMLVLLYPSFYVLYVPCVCAPIYVIECNYITFVYECALTRETIVFLRIMYTYCPHINMYTKGQIFSEVYKVIVYK